jgi:hypothetical protein
MDTATSALNLAGTLIHAYKRLVAALEKRNASLARENAELKRDLKLALAAVDFYGKEDHYELSHFFTRASVHEVGTKPSLVRHDGNPIMYDRGDIARSVLARMRLVVRKSDVSEGSVVRPDEEKRPDS